MNHKVQTISEILRQIALYFKEHPFIVVGMALAALTFVLIIQELKHETDVHLFQEKYTDSELRYREYIEMKNEKKRQPR